MPRLSGTAVCVVSLCRGLLVCWIVSCKRHVTRSLVDIDFFRVRPAFALLRKYHTALFLFLHPHQNHDFVYQFRAPEQPGTYFYHGHVGLARELGAQGLFIVNPRSGQSWPDSMKHDESRNFMIQDWYHAPGLSLTTGILQKAFRWSGDPQSILVNGKGSFDCADNAVYQCADEDCEVEDADQPNICTAFERPYFMPSYRWGKGHPGGHCGPENCDGPDIVKVTKGKTYLFRLANAAALSLFNVAVEGHKMTVVSLDANPVEPHVVSSLDLHSGQKASVLITADQDVSSYWISITIRGRSAPRSASVIMRYDGASDTPPSNSALQTLKDSQPVWDDVNFTLTQQRSFRHLQGKQFPSPLPAEDVARRFVFLQTQERFEYDSEKVQYISNAPKKESAKEKQIGLKIGEGEERPENSCQDGFLRWGMARVSKALPTDPVLHSLYYTDENDDITEEYGYYKLELGKVYEVVIQNYPACNGVCETHSMHIHGYHFWVVGTYEGEYNGTLPAYGGAGTYLRDTVMLVGAGKGMKPKERKGCGYTVIRFKADNPGVWPFHCHALWHTIMGQGVVFYFDKETLPAPNLDHHIVCGNKITRAILSSAHKKTPSEKPTPPKSHLRTETTYAYKVTYPSCKRGYWDSGCGQPEMKQKATGVKCFAITGNTESETDDKYCVGLEKPVATDRTCPKTKSCRKYCRYLPI